MNPFKSILNTSEWKILFLNFQYFPDPIEPQHVPQPNFSRYSSFSLPVHFTMKWIMVEWNTNLCSVIVSGKPNSEINLTSQIKRDRKSTTYLQLEYRIMFQKQHFYELFFILRIFVKQYEMYFNYNEQIPNNFFLELNMY